MSNRLITLTASRVLGSLARNAVMLRMGDIAKDDGTGIWASKQTLAEDLDTSRKTVIGTIKGLVSDGLLFEIGKRRNRNGFTFEYAINVGALEALPLTASAKRKQDEQEAGRPDPSPSVTGQALKSDCRIIDPSPSVTGQGSEPVTQRYATRNAALRHPSPSVTQTLIEPISNQSPPTPQGGKSGRVSFPDDWTLPAKADLTPEARAYAEQWPDGAYEAEGEAFANYRRGTGDKQKDWAAVWAARVIALHAHVMRAAKAGVSLAGASVAVTKPAANSPCPRRCPERSMEDEQSAALREVLRGAISPALYDRWLEHAALVFGDMGVRLYAPSEFAAHQIMEQFGCHIRQGLTAVGKSKDYWIRPEVSPLAPQIAARA